MKKLVLLLFLTLTLLNCAGRKIVAKNCEKAGNENYYICENL